MLLHNKRLISLLFVVFLSLVIVSSVISASDDASLETSKELNFIQKIFSSITSKISLIANNTSDLKFALKNGDLYNTTDMQIASIVNGKLINNSLNYPYFQLYNNFSDVKFKRFVKAKEIIFAELSNSMQDNIKGLNIKDRGYVIHVLYCNKFENYCALTINGIPTGKFYSSQVEDLDKQTKFMLDNNYVLRIKSIVFDYCDGKRFCDYYFDAYDIVEIEVERIGRD